MATTSQLNAITRKYTAAASFNVLLDAGGGYYPSLRCLKSSGYGTKPNRMEANLVILADAYDAAQAARNDQRRAYRC